MAKYQQHEFDGKVIKFKGKSSHDCYKLIWQWIKEKLISLSLFEALCEIVALKLNKENKGTNETTVLKDKKRA